MNNQTENNDMTGPLPKLLEKQTESTTQSQPHVPTMAPFTVTSETTSPPQIQQQLSHPTLSQPKALSTTQNLPFIPSGIRDFVKVNLPNPVRSIDNDQEDASMPQKSHMDQNVALAYLVRQNQSIQSSLEAARRQHRERMWRCHQRALQKQWMAQNYQYQLHVQHQQRMLFQQSLMRRSTSMASPYLRAPYIAHQPMGISSQQQQQQQQHASGYLISNPGVRYNSQSTNNNFVPVYQVSGEFQTIENGMTPDQVLPPDLVIPTYLRSAPRRSRWNPGPSELCLAKRKFQGEVSTIFVTLFMYVLFTFSNIPTHLLTHTHTYIYIYRLNEMTI
jgi:hypothetical protein